MGLGFLPLGLPFGALVVQSGSGLVVGGPVRRARLRRILGLHLWRRNALLSILGGTAVHVTLASTVFVG